MILKIEVPIVIFFTTHHSFLQCMKFLEHVLANTSESGMKLLVHALPSQKQTFPVARTMYTLCGITLITISSIREKSSMQLSLDIMVLGIHSRSCTCITTSPTEKISRLSLPDYWG